LSVRFLINKSSSVLLHIFDTIPDQHRGSLLVLLRQCFHSVPVTPEHAGEHDDRFCSQADTLKRVLVLDGDAVIGFATAYRRTISRHGRAIVLGGLGDVCTDPVRRHAGVATAVVRAAMHELHTVECDLAYLCADVNNPGIVRLYGQVGFVPLNHPHTFRGKSGKRYTDTDAMIAPVRSPAVFQAVLEDREPFDIGIGNW
jgi:ribosomal protein S18 acetylase RimI-like enzyme